MWGGEGCMMGVTVEIRHKERPAIDLRRADDVPLGTVRCGCGRVVSTLFTLESDPTPCCAECIRAKRSARKAAGGDR